MQRPTALQFPPVIEALLEMRYETVDGRPLSERAGRVLHQAIADDFPDTETRQDHQINVQVQAQGGQLQTSVQPPGRRIICKARPANRLVQLTESALTVNMLSPYGSWAALRDTMMHQWRTAQEHLGLRQGQQMILRYVNRLERHPQAPRVGDWLKAGAFVPEAVLSASAGFGAKVQLQSRSETMYTNVSIGSFAAPNQQPDAPGALLLDIEVISDLSSLLPTQSLASMADRMHQQAQKAFFSSVTDKALSRWSA